MLRDKRLVNPSSRKSHAIGDRPNNLRNVTCILTHTYANGLPHSYDDSLNLGEKIRSNAKPSMAKARPVNNSKLTGSNTR